MGRGALSVLPMRVPKRGVTLVILSQQTERERGECMVLQMPIMNNHKRKKNSGIRKLLINVI